MPQLKILALWLLASLHAFAAVAYVQSAKALPAATSGTVAFGSNVTAGDLLTVSVEGFASSGTATPTDTLSTNYKLLFSVSGVGSSTLQFFVGIAPSSGADTVSFSGVNA